jgi:hypothetical protein
MPSPAPRPGLLTPESAGLLRPRDWPRSARRWAFHPSCTWAPAWTTAGSSWPHRGGQGRRAGKRHRRSPGSRQRPRVDEREGDQHRPLFCGLRRLHGLRRDPAGQRAPCVPDYLFEAWRRSTAACGTSKRIRSSMPEDDRPHRQEAQGPRHRQGARRVLMDMADRRSWKAKILPVWR